MVTAALTRFATPPDPLTSRERLSAMTLAIVVALTRWPALSKTMWDWDEALFGLALRDYDVSNYHPHPPGFPLFVGLGKLIPLDGFHALQLIAFFAALLVFPAAFLLARELRANAFVALATGVLLAFMPNVWFYGGTALSDVPSMVLSLVAADLLLRGCRSPRALIGGSVVLGIAVGFRPQNLLIALVPFAIALLCRRRTAIAGAGIVAVIVLTSYGVAARESGGWQLYRETLAHHERYIRETDSFLSPIRPSLFRVADDFFLRPYRAPAINIAIALLALVAFARRRAHVLGAIAIFGPFCLFAWLYLDFHSVSRFSIAYMPLFAILAADGIDALQRARSFMLAALVALMLIWTWPALKIVHDSSSPPVAAIEWIRSNIDPRTSVIYVDERLGAHAALLLPDYRRRDLGEGAPPGAIVLSEDAREGARNFIRDRARPLLRSIDSLGAEVDGLRHPRLDGLAVFHRW